MKFAVATALVGCLAGCQHDAPCMRMMDPSPLLQQAAVLRLDVYDARAHCDGATLAPGAPPPLASRSAGAGESLQIDVPAGRHMLLLSAFADAAATELLGSACTESDFAAGSSACFDLTVEPAAFPDGGAPDFARPNCNPSPDDCGAGFYCASDGSCAAGCKSASDCPAKCDATRHVCVDCLQPSDCPSGKRCSPSGACVDGCDLASGAGCPGAQMCCANFCLDTSSDLSSCGACGRPCASTGVVTPLCSGSVCKPSCATGLLDCNHPIAPAADDGCESSANDVAHCGGCSNVCNLANATAACPSGSCAIASCAGGFFDCNAQAGDGCECAGKDLLDGMKGCCAGGCQAAHGDGYTHAFTDCVSFGSYSLQLAKDAAQAYALAGETDSFVDDTSAYYCVRKRTSPPHPMTLECVCWAFAGAASGYTRHVLAECQTPTAADQPWK